MKKLGIERRPQALGVSALSSDLACLILYLKNFYSQGADTHACQAAESGSPSVSLQKKQSCIASFNRYICQSCYAVWFLLLDLTKLKLNSFTYMLWKNISKNRKYNEGPKNPSFSQSSCTIFLVIFNEIFPSHLLLY